MCDSWLHLQHTGEYFSSTLEYTFYHLHCHLCHLTWAARAVGSLKICFILPSLWWRMQLQSAVLIRLHVLQVLGSVSRPQNKMILKKVKTFHWFPHIFQSKSRRSYIVLWEMMVTFFDNCGRCHYLSRDFLGRNRNSVKAGLCLTSFSVCPKHISA